MSTARGISCDEFDDAVDELAVGTLSEPGRSALLSHAATCPCCEAQLNEMAGLADRLLLFGPEVEPPAGFEVGVVARMTGRTATGAAPPASRRRTRMRQLVAVAAVAAVLVASGIALGRATNHPSPAAQAVHHGEIIATSGRDIGDVELLTAPEPHVLLSLRGPQPWGVLSCQLVLPHGQWVTVGSWGYQDVQGGRWAVGVNRSLVGAVRMRIVAQDGTVVASAALT